MSRRGLLIGAVGVALGAGGTKLFSRWVAAPDPQSPATDAESPVERGTVAWALAMLSRPEEELLSAAGDLERVSMRHRDARLVPCFQRLLDVATASAEDHADEAGACAVRSLARLERVDLLRAASERLVERTDRPLTRAEIGFGLEQLGHK